ncbi:MAG: lipopolysaccharide heptosyltransferase II [Pseudomonadales bacterium]
MRILVVSPSWVGDMIMSQALLRRLKANYPECTIDVLAPDWCRAVLQRMPEVSEAIAMPVGHGKVQWGVRKLVAKQLQVAAYDSCYVLPNSLKSALIPWMANIPVRTGWRGEMRYGLLTDIRALDKAAFPLMVERYAALADKKPSSAQQMSPVLRPQLRVDENAQAALFADKGLTAGRLIAFCPGAEFGPAKRWPHYHFAELAKMLIAAGYQVACLGSAKDREAVDQIASLLSPEELAQFFALAGDTRLEQAIDILAGASLVVSNDSGLMHMAAAVNTPLIALYGPTSPEFTPPLSDDAQVVRLIDGFIKIRRADGEQGYHQSMIDIAPAEIFSRAMTVITQ